MEAKQVITNKEINISMLICSSQLSPEAFPLPKSGGTGENVKISAKMSSFVIGGENVLKDNSFTSIITVSISLYYRLVLDIHLGKPSSHTRLAGWGPGGSFSILKNN